MPNFIKNAVKLLPIVENVEDKISIYTEFDGSFVVGDRLYIMVDKNSGGTYNEDYYKLDSLYNSGYTSETMGYILLSKNGNKLKLDKDYDTFFQYTGITSNCYIGRLYMSDISFTGGTINGAMLNDAGLSLSDTLNLQWKQGIVVNTKDNTIRNINFKSKYGSDDIILKTEINSAGDIESYYTYNNYGNGLSIINTTTGSTNINIIGCNIYDGIFNSCTFSASSNRCYIYGGLLTNCTIGNKYTIDGGKLYQSTILSGVTNYIIWNKGTWSNDWTGTTGNPFSCSVWSGGTWLNGIFPYIVWYDGRFMDGVFGGYKWYDGTFNGGIFEGNTSIIWIDGIFNGGTFSGCTWENGIFNGDTFTDGVWENGVFNGGVFQYSDWVDGVFNGGEMDYSNWSGGTCNGGILKSTKWYDGIVNNGELHDINWYDGVFHSGTFTDGTWYNGKFYNGSIFNSGWVNGELYFGTINELQWTGGTWYDGIANSLVFHDGIWYNGIFNFGEFRAGDWYDGSFNGGYFGISGEPTQPTWHGGVFYFGEINGDWVDGTFYTGKKNSVIPEKDDMNKNYLQYNKTGLVQSMPSTVKLPKLRKF